MRGRVHKPSQWRTSGASAVLAKHGVPLTHASTCSPWPFACWFFQCCARVVGDLERMCVGTLRDLPHTCSCTWCFIQKTKRDSTGSRTREYFIRTQIFFYFHYETCSKKAELKLHQHKKKRIYLRWTLEGCTSFLYCAIRI
jgi:hypothetical protein